MSDRSRGEIRVRKWIWKIGMIDPHKGRGIRAMNGGQRHIKRSIGEETCKVKRNK